MKHTLCQIVLPLTLTEFVVSEESANPSILIATLGAEPQVISLATDLLLRMGAGLCGVTVLHSAADRPPIDRALPALQAFFAERPGWPPLVCRRLPIDDVLTPADLESFGDALFGVLQAALRDGARVHLLLAGGRKPMAMVGMSVAQLLLGADDPVWYLWSDEALRRSGRPYVSDEDEARLVPIALPPVGPAPRFTDALRAPTAAAARTALAQAQVRRLRHFVEQELTPAERAVAALLAREVLTVAQVAARLHKSPKTVSNQLNQIYAKLETRLGVEPDASVKREFLRRALGPYFVAGGG